MGGKSGGGIPVTDYRMSMHYRVCHGPADALLGIYVGEKVAWEGEVTAEGAVAINRPDLFGGNEKEGGVAGSAYWLPGGPSQVLPDFLAARLGLTSATAPGYRTMASVFFTGSSGFSGSPLDLYFNNYDGAGFLWSSNNPYLKSIWMKVRRRPRGLSTATSFIVHGGFTVSTNHNSVTVNGATATVTQGDLATINGVSILLNGQSLTINGIEIVTDPDEHTVSIGGVTGDVSGGVVTVGDYTVTVGSTYTLSGIHVANVTVSAQVTTVDANPAHIIYECLTNTEWGQGGAPSTIDTQSFEDGATTLYNEGFGLSLMWTKQTDIESFVSEILDHIQATLFVHPRTGLMTLKLIRADYDIDDLPILNADNCKITDFERKAWGETINEIVVTWTNPQNEQEETVSAQHNANIAIQGNIISDSRNYYGVRNADLALKLAFRDLATAAAPLAVFDVQADRTAWDFIPGGCVRLQYPEYGIDDVVGRITKLDYGKPGDASIKISIIEDIFAEASADYTLPDPTQWVDPAEDPSAPAWARLITAPGYFLAQTLSQADIQAVDYPEVAAAALVSQTGTDTYGYTLYTERTQPNGDVYTEAVATKPILGHATLPTALAAEATSLVTTFGEVDGGPGPRPGGFVFIGNLAEQGQEIALIASVDEDGWVLKRGCLDTVPRPWSDGTVVWFIGADSNIVITSDARTAGETVRYKVTPSTSQGTLSIDVAPVIAAVMTGRPHLPNRPAHVTVGGISFGSIDLSGSSPTVVPVTWANRNRTLEDDVVLGWTDATITPETGQTTVIKLYSTSGDFIDQATGLTGTSYDIPISLFGSYNVADVRVYAARDSLLSLQGHTVRVKVRPAGWGDNWGDEWGSGSGGSAPGDPDPDPVPPDPDPGPDFPPPPPWRPSLCPVVTARVLLANADRTGPGTTVAAGDLKPGDWVWTRHELTETWGAFRVAAVSVAHLAVYRAAGYPDATAMHRFWVDHDWVRMHEIGHLLSESADVAKITVDDARTYITVEDDGRWVLSHNIKENSSPE